MSAIGKSGHYSSASFDCGSFYKVNWPCGRCTCCCIQSLSITVKGFYSAAPSYRPVWSAWIKPCHMYRTDSGLYGRHSLALTKCTSVIEHSMYRETKFAPSQDRQNTHIFPLSGYYWNCAVPRTHCDKSNVKAWFWKSLENILLFNSLGLKTNPW